MNAFAAVVSVLLVGGVSLIAGWVVGLSRSRLPAVVRALVAFAVGALLGDVFIHLLPDVYAEEGSGVLPAVVVLAGFVGSFVLERLVRQRAATPSAHPELPPTAAVNLFGDAAHNFVDGAVIAASYAAGMKAGIATTIAVLLHELPQELGDFGVLLSSGLSFRRALWLNFAISLTALAGALLTLVIGEVASSVTRWMVPLATGGLIYLAASDLVPDLHQRATAKSLYAQVPMIAAGVAVMTSLVFLD